MAQIENRREIVYRILRLDIFSLVISEHDLIPSNHLQLLLKTAFERFTFI